ncbi:hypothetical protein ACG873_20995 [Mesorhizobium sp. AaZ16]|uniref:hypothetical protein n=1 Tax=Mesorhizobium sp. AaZ16 TaxID=3402289 RepID=UPI00374E4E75
MDTGYQNTISGLLRKRGEMLANLAPRIKWRATGARVLLFQLLGNLLTGLAIGLGIAVGLALAG